MYVTDAQAPRGRFRSTSTVRFSALERMRSSGPSASSIQLRPTGSSSSTGRFTAWSFDLMATRSAGSATRAAPESVPRTSPGTAANASPSPTGELSRPTVQLRRHEPVVDRQEVGRCRRRLSLPSGRGLSTAPPGGSTSWTPSLKNAGVRSQRTPVDRLRSGGGGDPGEFALPAGLAIDPENRIWVADSANHRIQVFDYVGDVP
ncbi:MAG: hypothetical protein H6816_13360 [Phycisphaerales bacterium]|nr:hypothetical protein [Phycisphaerales bacterium]